MDETKLKPCPFCGGKPKVLKGVGGKPIKEDLQNTTGTRTQLLDLPKVP